VCETKEASLLLVVHYTVQPWPNAVTFALGNVYTIFGFSAVFGFGFRNPNRI